MKKELTLRVEHDVAALGAEWDALFATGSDLQTRRDWFSATIATAIPPGSTPHFVAIADGHGPALLAPMLAGPGPAFGSLTTPYTCLYRPASRTDPPVPGDAWRAFGRYCRRWPLTRFEALDPDEPQLPALRAGLATAGLVTRIFAHFGNWHERVPPDGWPGYLEARPGQLRETIKRRTRAAAKAGAEIQIAREPENLMSALLAYEEVYRRSWKQPEPYPDFNAALMRAAATSGALRFGVMTFESRPIAAQYWSVVGRKATVLKLAHDENVKALSPGTVLTAATIRELIERDEVVELDFGRGDDPYKKNWVGKRRERVGLLGLNVTTRTGALAWAMHDGGRMLRMLRRRTASRDTSDE